MGYLPSSGGASDDALYVDSYSSLQAALTAFAASSNTKLVFGAGQTYTITATLTVDALVGKIIDGNGATIAMTGGATIYGLSLTGTWRDSVIRNLKFTSDGGGTHIGIVWGTNANNTTVEHCQFGAMFQAIAYQATARNHISHCNVTGATNAGIILSGEYCVVSNCNVYSCTGLGVYIPGGNNTVADCTLQYNGIAIQIDSGANSDHGNIVGNTINHNTKCGIYVSGMTYGMVITGNQISANNGSNLGASPADSSFGIYVNSGTGLQIVSNMFLNNKFSLGINGINKSTIQGNRFDGDPALTTRHAYEVGGTNTSYLFSGNVVGNDLTGGNTVVLATDLPGATIVANTNLVV